MYMYICIYITRHNISIGFLYIIRYIYIIQDYTEIDKYIHTHIHTHTCGYHVLAYLTCLTPPLNLLMHETLSYYSLRPLTTNA